MDKRRLALGTLLGGAANLCRVCLQIVMLPVMARLLGPNEYGLYALAMPTITFVTMLADGGLGSSLARESEADEKFGPPPYGRYRVPQSFLGPLLLFGLCLPATWPISHGCHS